MAGRDAAGEKMVFVRNVDHSKSNLIGLILAETGSLAYGKIIIVETPSERGKAERHL
jgi:sulfate adenylyltransferase subunit 1 (EFTu-like GTPase family)